MPIKVTAIKCPSCKGTGMFGCDLLDVPCMWCRGEKKLRKGRAVEYAAHVWMLAGGGYICGDHDYDDMREMERESSKIRAAFGLEPLKK